MFAAPHTAAVDTAGVLAGLLDAANRGDLDAGIAAEKAAFAAVLGSEDAREGIGAFLGKRTPRFKGA